MLKKLFISLVIFFTLLGCSTTTVSNKADNPLDGGRYFIENYLKGDLKHAKDYLLIEPKNLAFFDTLSQQYFALDREGRQQLRLASIQINEVKNIDSTTTIINYQNSYDKIVHELKVVPTTEGWKVDLKFTYGPKL